MTALKRPSAAPASPTLIRLREVAMERFAKRGYGGASMSEIATRVGIRKASLYNYFDSKEDLLLDLVEGCLEAWGEASLGVLDEEGPLEDRLWRHLLDAVGFAREHPDHVAVLRVATTQIGGPLGERVNQILDGHCAHHHEWLKRLFGEAVDSGELTLERAEIEDLCLAWASFADGLLTNMIFRPIDGDRYEARLEQIWAVFWRGASGRWPRRRAEKETT